MHVYSRGKERNLLLKYLQKKEKPLPKKLMGAVMFC